MRWCWHPEAAVRAGRGTGQGSVWPALHSGGAHAAAGASWPARAYRNERMDLDRFSNTDGERNSTKQKCH